MARRCDAAGGNKVEFSQYIMDLWESIGYSPGEIEVAAVYDDHGDDVEQQTGGSFTPVKIMSDPDKFTGVAIKQFHKDTDPGDIVEFLINSCLPETSKDSVFIKPNGCVSIKDLDNTVCRTLIENIHNKRHFYFRLGPKI